MTVLLATWPQLQGTSRIPDTKAEKSPAQKDDFSCLCGFFPCGQTVQLWTGVAFPTERASLKCPGFLETLKAG